MHSPTVSSKNTHQYHVYHHCRKNRITMESLNIKTYLLYAIYIIRTTPIILFMVGLIGILNGVTVFLPETSGLGDLLSGSTLLATIFISPVIYGIYYEVIEERYSSVVMVFRRYVGGYLLLLFCMYIPIIFTAAMVTSASGGEPNGAYVMLTIVLFSLLFIYVIPTYYVSGQIVDSIAAGVQFFLKNLFASAPLLLMALGSELLLLLSHFKLEWLRENNPALFVTIDFTIYMTASVIDFLLFIILIYIVRNRSTKKREFS